MTEEQLRILKELDIPAYVAWAAESTGKAITDSTAEISIHKARVISTQVPEPMRESSKEWLIKNGYYPGL